MSRKKLSTTVYLTEDQDRALKELSARTRVPVAVFVRAGIDLLLARHGYSVAEVVAFVAGGGK